jgi:hypothetical protein
VSHRDQTLATVCAATATRRFCLYFLYDDDSCLKECMSSDWLPTRPFSKIPDLARDHPDRAARPTSPSSADPAEMPIVRRRN